jgi:redox-sensitive bicupin YhaK (pirin superfamily)
MRVHERSFDMTQDSTLIAPPPALERPRIVHRTRGHHHGPVTRLMSPGDVGEMLKPFVFLDLVDAESSALNSFGLHPHSGIATVTHLFEGNVRYEDTTGARGVLPEGGVEWFKAGHGAWHGGGGGDARRARGFQLWLALPPEHELGPVESFYQAPGEIALDGPARVLIGTHGAVTSTLEALPSINYLAVRLKDGETWRYQRPAGHTVAWIAVSRGGLTTPERIDIGELVAFEAADGAIDFHADCDTEFVLGSAVPHRHDLVLGYYSVHTSPEALAAGERHIREVQRQLQKDGRM